MRWFRRRPQLFGDRHFYHHNLEDLETSWIPKDKANKEAWVDETDEERSTPMVSRTEGLDSWRLEEYHLDRRDLRHFVASTRRVIESGENQMKLLSRVSFARDGKGVPNLCSGVASRTTKKVLVIVGFRRLRKSENKPRRQSKNWTMSLNLWRK